MKFRPCIDIHAGVVKQIVGSTLTESEDDKPAENFVATLTAADYAK
jgi:phosphoribosylformimino-5-aminoimidazole carboxamide ribotide isomerase